MKCAGAFLLCLTPMACALPSAADAQRHPDVARVEALVIDGTNEFRRHEHLQAVERNARLDEAAREFAAFLARTGKFDHDADGRTPSDRARAHGYDLCLIAENISYEFNSADFETRDLARRFVEGWKSSPGHRKNMLKGDATEIAVAVARGAANGPPRYYAVQLLGRPKSARIEFRVSNPSDTAVRYRVAEREFVVQSRQVRTHTECGPTPVSFEIPGETRFTAQGGERFVVRREGGAPSVRRE
jgi:uncharacterized protein YkwD